MRLYERWILKGNDVVIGDSVIGDVGFGYWRDEEGKRHLRPHKYLVLIEDNVHIKNFVVIDRGIERNTVIGEGTIINNLVHIGHSTQIGKNCLIGAGSIIAGNCDIADNVTIWNEVKIKERIKIGEGAIIGMGAIVVKDVSPYTLVRMREPAIEVKKL